ncbi:high-potential iron-sulfur protein [Dyadobacter frigoris]|uniref:High-potential iron-sulfur protein n=1 Tax=Dyadobacter frigoris TaxID=2576211 RepID=A0A4U6CR14_9BACT|nr:high-potential iron-sulfur protein [Dyadobacter frigoris]TKT86992.1 high-potential iron-sulfur protein [Dyadobacter frigoris]
MTKEIERRKFLQHCFGLSLMVSTGGFLLSSCAGRKKTVANKNTSPVAKVNPCEDLTGVDAVDVEKRKALGYVGLSPIQDKQCGNCKLWIPVKDGKECGGCLLFAGPVSEDGHCTYWAPQV